MGLIQKQTSDKKIEQTTNQGGKLPAKGADAPREVNNKIGNLTGLVEGLKKDIPSINERYKVSLSNHFESINLNDSAPKIRTSIQQAAAKTEAELITLWAKQHNKLPALEKWLKEQGCEDGKFPMDSKKLLEGWQGRNSYKGSKVGLIEKFHREFGVIMNVPGSCPVQLLKEVEMLLKKIEPTPPAATPTVTITPPSPKEELLVMAGDVEPMKPIGGTVAMTTPAVTTGGSVVGAPNGDLNKYSRHFKPTLAGLVAASPIGKLCEECVQGCLNAAGLGGGGIGKGGGTGGSSF